MKQIYLSIILTLFFAVGYANTFSSKQITKTNQQVVLIKNAQKELLKPTKKNLSISQSSKAKNHLDSIILEDGSRKIFEYNNNDQVIDYKHYAFDFNTYEVIYKEHHIFEYNNDGNQTLYEFNYFDEYEGWILSKREEYSYYSDGTIKTQISWDREYLSNHAYSKTEFSYNGNISTVKAFSWSEDNLKWEDTGHQIIEIKNNLPIKADVYALNEETGIIELAFKMVFEYNSKEQNTVITTYIRDEDSGEWVEYFISETEYNSDNNIIHEKESMNAFGFEMISSETFYTYNSAGNITKEEIYSYDFFTGSSSMTEKKEYVYKNGVLFSETEYSSEFTGEMVENYKNEFTYNTTAITSDLIIPFVDEYFNTSDLFGIEYYEFGLLTKVKHSEINWETLALEPTRVASYYYSNGTTVPELSNDATLNSLSVGSKLIEGFNASIYSYTITLAAGTVAVPTVTATTNHKNATYTIEKAKQLPGTTNVIVTAEDGSKKTYAINFELAKSSDTSLSKIQVDGGLISNFNPSTLNYNYGVQSGTTKVPVVTVTTNNKNAKAFISAASGVPGITSILVTAEDGVTVNTYNVTFFVIASNDASLSQIQIDGKNLSNFNTSTYQYDVELPNGTSVTPQILATPTDKNANVKTTQANDLTGTATIVVTAVDGVTQNTYSINFTVALSNDVTLSEIKIDGKNYAAFDPSVKKYSITLDKGVTAIPEVSVLASNKNAGINIHPSKDSGNIIIIEVTAEDNTVGYYEITFILQVSISNVNLSDIKAYPNPFNDYLNLVIPEQLLLNYVVIYNNLGQQVYKNDNTIGNKNIIETGNLERGFYLIHYYFTDGNSYQMKISKQ